MYAVHPHPHHHHHHHHHNPQHQQQQQQQQAIFAQQQQQQQQQQQANMLFFQYNQLNSMQGTYSNPALTSARYMQQPLEQQQQGYRPDQLVPQTKTPVQQPIKHSSPINVIPTSSPKAWMHSPQLQNPEGFLPIIRTPSTSKHELIPHMSTSNSIQSTTSTPPMAMSFESPKLSRRHHSKRHSSSDRRQRLHSGSSCYESDSVDIHSNDEQEYEVKFSSAFYYQR